MRTRDAATLPQALGRPTDAQRLAMKPSSWVLFLRTFVPYQVLRFIVVNLRMLKMIKKSHG
jgi:hypothetical protein